LVRTAFTGTPELSRVVVKRVHDDDRLKGHRHCVVVDVEKGLRNHSPVDSALAIKVGNDDGKIELDANFDLMSKERFAIASLRASGSAA